MAGVFESVTVTISRREYAGLLKKAQAFDAYRRKVKADVERGWTLTDIERSLFLNDEESEMQVLETEAKLKERESKKAAAEVEEEPEEGMEEFFTDEEWQKVVDIAEEEKEKENELI